MHSHCDNQYRKNHNHRPKYKEYEVSFLRKVFDLSSSCPYRLSGWETLFDWTKPLSNHWWVIKLNSKTCLRHWASWKHFPNMNLLWIQNLMLQLHIWNFQFFPFSSFKNYTNMHIYNITVWITLHATSSTLVFCVLLPHGKNKTIFRVIKLGQLAC